MKRRPVFRNSVCSFRTKAVALSSVGILLVSAACGRRPSDVLSDEDMTSLLADMYIAEAYVSTDPQYSLNDSMKKVLRQGVLAQHHTTEKEFETSLDWYGHNMDRLGEIYEEVEKRIEAESKSPGKDEKNGSSSSSELWTGPTRAALSSRSTDRIRFDIEGGKIKKGDSEVEWEFSAPVLPGRISAFMAVDYSDGTFSHTAKTFVQPGNLQIILKLSPEKKPARVYGQALYIPAYRETAFLDSIRLISRPVRTPGDIPMY